MRIHRRFSVLACSSWTRTAQLHNGPLCLLQAPRHRHNLRHWGCFVVSTNIAIHLTCLARRLPAFAAHLKHKKKPLSAAVTSNQLEIKRSVPFVRGSWSRLSLETCEPSAVASFAECARTRPRGQSRRRSPGRLCPCCRALWIGVMSAACGRGGIARALPSTRGRMISVTARRSLCSLLASGPAAPIPPFPHNPTETRCRLAFDAQSGLHMPRVRGSGQSPRATAV